jgi:hypothetical protein
MRLIRLSIPLPATIIALAGAVGFLGGCADGEGGLRGPCGEEGCAADCPEPGGNCDLRRRSCQKTVFRAVRCVRGVDGKMPPVDVISVDEYRERLGVQPESDAGDAGDVDAGASDGGLPDAGDATSEALPEVVDPWSRALSLLGLLPPASDTAQEYAEFSLQTTAAFYSPGEKTVTIVDRDQPEDDDYAVLLLAHELVHSLQDQEVGFREFYRYAADPVDAWISCNCLTEGEADLFADLAWAHLHGLAVADLYWPESGASDVKYARRAVLTGDAPYVVASSLLAYAVGESYLRDLWLAEGSRGVRALYGAPPLSAIYWMNGYRENREREEHWLLPLSCEDASAPAGFDPYTRTRLGPFIVFAFLGTVSREGEVHATEEAWQDARQWRADSISVFVNHGTDATAVSWRIRFDDEEIPRRYRRVVKERRTGLDLRARVNGQEIEILAGDDPPVLEGWSGTDPDACPENADPEE